MRAEDYLVDIVAVIAITIIEVVAIYNDMNGIALSASIGGIGAIAGAPIISSVRRKLTKVGK